MARNFHIHVVPHPEGLHLHLSGDLDGSSASMLVNTLKAHGNHTGDVVVHTDGLGKLHDFGVAVLQNHLPGLQNGFRRLIFVGEKRDSMT